MRGTNYFGVGPDSHTTWAKKFCWLPKRCALSNKLIWLKTAHRGMKVIIGPGDPVFLYWWHDSREHFIWKLKGN